MKNNAAANELVLNGTQLSSDEHCAELVARFKKELADSHEVPVVLDLRKLATIYSKGISIILGIYKSCTANHRDFKIIVSSDDVFSLFKMLKLDKVFSIQKAEE